MKDKRIDAYISKAQDFARPVLNHIRAIVHKACPDVEETMKWSFPHFDYKGEMMCSMASFKQHCAFGFWKAALLEDKKNVIEKTEREAMGHFGRITSVKDLPSDRVFISLIKQAMKLNDEGIKLPPKAKATTAKELKIPAYFSSALKSNKKAFSTFNKFSPSSKKEYVEWIAEAKTEETRERRLETAIEWIAEGKVRNWKYLKK
jgi:uncharacterized protein YdeI (YjbR/CyaY-like superfamily)